MSDSAVSPVRRRVVSGMRPTGKPHLGNYMGALHNWVKLQHEYECFFFIADLHALTTDYADTGGLQANIKGMAIDWLAAGLDPAKCAIFVQSTVSAHTELHALLSMITPLGWLERVPSYKDQQENLTEKDLTTYGFLGYPLLQTADILLYGLQNGSLHVPVGADQVAHVELTREVARRFNSMYAGAVRQHIETPGSGVPGKSARTSNALLQEPQVLLTPTPKLPGTDGRKMSKSYGNFILLADTEPEIRAKLKPMVTDPARVRRADPGDPDKCPVGDLHKVFSSAETLANVYTGCRSAGIGCIECKSWLADAVVALVVPMQERRAYYQARPDEVAAILEQGQATASLIAAETLLLAQRAMGVRP